MTFAMLADAYSSGGLAEVLLGVAVIIGILVYLNSEGKL